MFFDCFKVKLIIVKTKSYLPLVNGEGSRRKLLQESVIGQDRASGTKIDANQKAYELRQQQDPAYLEKRLE